MDIHAKIYVAGHRGLVGSALIRTLKGRGFCNLITRSHGDLELTRQADVEAFFNEQQPEYVFLAAARVGGIHANNSYPADFIRDNLAIQTNVIHSSWRAGVKRLMFLGSSCIYPRNASQPMTEECLLSGELEPTNRPYAIAKISGIEMCWAYNRQHKTRFFSVMPTNLYGPGDNYHPENSHVIPALIRRFHEAKITRSDSVTIWGSGNPRREFLYSTDLAEACVMLMSLSDNYLTPVLALDRNTGVPPLLNIGSGEELSIRELAHMVGNAVGFRGRIEFDLTRPDGAPRKLLDISRISSLGWRANVMLSEGLKSCYKDFLAQIAHDKS